MLLDLENMRLEMDAKLEHTADQIGDRAGVTHEYHKDLVLLNVNLIY